MDSNTEMVLKILSGVALFLFGMSSMSDGLKKVAGNKMELILYKLTNSPVKGFLLGTAVTCVIQSSSAATVMVVGFVNSGMMKVSQAIGVILGANIGTSITGWIVCMSYIEGAGWASYFSSTTITAVMAIIGVLLTMFGKKDTFKHTGNILLGFAVLMTGMSMMSGAVAPLKSDPIFIDTMKNLTNPFLSMLFGIIFAGILQSSSAAIGVLQALSTTGALSFASVYPLVMGIGVGASFPVLLSAIGANKNGKRTSFIYLLISIICLLLGSLVFYPLAAAGLIPFAGMTMDPFSTALTNTGFRLVFNTLLLPFIPLIKKLAYIIIPSDAAELEDTGDFEKLEARLLNNPDIAYATSMEVMDGMAKKAKKNVLRAIRLLEEYSPEGYKKVAELESTLNKYEDKLGKYLVRLSSSEISMEQSRNISKSLQSIADFEAMGDYALQIADVAKSMNEKKQTFSLAAIDELTVIAAAMEEATELAVKAFLNNDAADAKRVFPLRELISLSSNDIKKRHIKRLKEGKCSMEMGFVQADILADMTRIVDHCANISLDIVKFSNQDFDVHRFLRKYTEENRSEYSDILRDYEVKYSI